MCYNNNNNKVVGVYRRAQHTKNAVVYAGRSTRPPRYNRRIGPEHAGTVRYVRRAYFLISRATSSTTLERTENKKHTFQVHYVVSRAGGLLFARLPEMSRKPTGQRSVRATLITAGLSRARPGVITAEDGRTVAGRDRGRG